jgi:hypothetical protein
MAITEWEFERALDAAILKRLRSDPAYVHAEDAEAQTLAEEQIEQAELGADPLEGRRGAPGSVGVSLEIWCFRRAGGVCAGGDRQDCRCLGWLLIVLRGGWLGETRVGRASRSR